MISEVHLPEKIFWDQKITGFKLKNCILGKNGTGKSTISQVIVDRYSNEYDVRIFQGYGKIIKENNGLSAIALGKENAELQPQIDKKNAELQELKKEKESKCLDFKEAEKAYDEKNKELESFYSKEASKIKHKKWAIVTYDKRDFKKDKKKIIENFQNGEDKKSSYFLTQSKITEYEKTIAEPRLKDNKIDSLKIPEQIDKYVKIVNDILIKNISKAVELKFESNEKENWVKEGLLLHKKEDYCAFCGSKISSNRWDDLNSYFNNEVKDLEISLKKAENSLSTLKNQVDEVQEIDVKNFYSKFEDNINNLNSKIKDAKYKYYNNVEILLNQIRKREDNIFCSLDPVNLDVSNDFDKINEIYSELFKKNKAFGDNLNEQQKIAKEKLKMNDVACSILQSDYFQKQDKLEELKNEKKIKEENYRNIKNKIQETIKNLNDLLKKTKDESIAADEINKKLKLLGNQSFVLEKVGNGNQQGQYGIKGRSISSLSTGEKNIVAFLWFICDLDNYDKKSDKQMLVIFDDPMNSNDDAAQYLIISELQKLLRNAQKTETQIFILTHNTHFYINLRYKWWVKANKVNYDKATFFLEKFGEKNKVIPIKKADDDIKTSYDELWKEVRWLYNQNKPEFMLNPLRRILETYQNFNRIDNICMNHPEAQKLFNVNSHSIDDVNTDLNGNSPTSIMNIVKQIFEDCNGMAHFNKYWENNK